MAGPITIISDTHLGRPRRAALSADALRPIWAESSQLIINGDIAELHHPDLEDEAEAQVIRLFELTMMDGIVLTLISGNHDPYISDLRHVHIAEGAVLVVTALLEAGARPQRKHFRTAKRILKSEVLADRHGAVRRVVKLMRAAR